MDTQATLQSISGNAYAILLNISNVSSDAITVEYVTIPGNLPNTMGNFIAIWANESYIPWNTPALQTIQISSNASSGSVIITGLDTISNSYIIGYAVGPTLTSGGQEYGNICTTAFVPQQSSETTIFSSSISLQTIGSTSLSFDYDLPDGITPKTNGAWAGLWQGYPSLYNTHPYAMIQIPEDYSRGIATFNNVVLMRGTSYTIALFMSGFQPSGSSTQKALACAESFDN